jgi:hypothetical protein
LLGVTLSQSLAIAHSAGHPSAATVSGVARISIATLGYKTFDHVGLADLKGFLLTTKRTYCNFCFGKESTLSHRLAARLNPGRVVPPVLLNGELLANRCHCRPVFSLY